MFFRSSEAIGAEIAGIYSYATIPAVLKKVWSPYRQQSLIQVKVYPRPTRVPPPTGI